MSLLFSTRSFVSKALSRPTQIYRCCAISTLSSNTCNPHIYIFPDNQSLINQHILSLLPTSPPTRDLIIGTTTSLPPTPSSFTENPKFLSILQEVLKEYACEDPGIVSQAQAFASQAGSSLGSGGMFFPQQQSKRQGKGGDGAGGASSQGGAGGAGRGGYVHLSDGRSPPDYGRIAWPEDIFGSLEVDGIGEIVGENGNYQESGTYRICTRDGVLGLSEFLKGKVVQKLRELEEKKGGDGLI